MLPHDLYHLYGINVDYLEALYNPSPFTSDPEGAYSTQVREPRWTG